MKPLADIVLSMLVAAVVLTATAAEPDRHIVRIHPDTPEQLERLQDLELDFVSEAPGFLGHADAVVTGDELEEIRQRGFHVEIVFPGDSTFEIPEEYHTYEETYLVFDSLESLHPDILHQMTVGFTQWRGFPIYGVKISGNVAVEEDEPAVLYNSVIHAREPLGNEVIIYLAKYLCSRYDTSATVRRWVDSLEIWLIPVLNPDGYIYMFDSAQTSPWWRKNQRDNNNNGRFDYDYDGVDLNRNFNWRWTHGGSTTPSSWTYRGPEPNSESETRTLCSLALARKPVFGISYHSYGEIVYYPWSFQGQHTPDDDVYTTLANRLGQLTGYQPGRDGGTNMADDWLYARTGQLDFLLETGTVFIEPAHRILPICQENFHGDTFLFNRVFYAGVWGHVKCAVTDSPLVAEVQVLDRVDTILDPRTSDPRFGRFHRVLNPGCYAFRFSAPGYDSLIISEVEVTNDSLTRLEPRLQPLVGIAEQCPPLPADRSPVSAAPNPFSTATTFTLVRSRAGPLTIYDATGRLVWDYLIPGHSSPVSVTWNGTDRFGNRLPAGVYFVKFRAETNHAVARMILKQ